MSDVVDIVITAYTYALLVCVAAFVLLLAACAVLEAWRSYRRPFPRGGYLDLTVRRRV